MKRKEGEMPESLRCNDIPANLAFSVRIALKRFDDKSSDLKFSKLMSQIKVPANVVCDTDLRGLAARSHTGDVLRGCQHHIV